MLKELIYLIFLTFSMSCLVGAVCGSSASDFNIISDNHQNSQMFQDLSCENYKKFTKKTLVQETPKQVIAKYKKIQSQSKKKNSSKIQKTLISKSIFKSGSEVKIIVYTEKSIKSVKGSIIKIHTDKSLNSSPMNSNNNIYNNNINNTINNYNRTYDHKFMKYRSGTWFYKLNTKKFKSGEFNLRILAKDDIDQKFKDSLNFTVDNIPPRIFSVATDLRCITAGEFFTITVKSDNTTKRVIANIGKINITFQKIDNDTWIKYTNFCYKELGKVAIKIFVFDNLNNSRTKTVYMESKPKYVLWNGFLLNHELVKVSYYNPMNAYERSVNELNKYATVYEGQSSNVKMQGNSYLVELGSTTRNVYSKSVKYVVKIAFKDPFIVYHEMAHVLHWEWSEYYCNWYAYNRTGYWFSNVDNSNF